MPVVNQGFSPEFTLKMEIENLISSYGPIAFKKMANELGLTETQLEKNEIISDISFSTAKEFFLTSYAFRDLSSSSKKTYISELNQFDKFVNKDGNLMLKSTFDQRLLLDYLLPYKGSNTRAKKCAFLRTFFRTVYEEFFKKDIDNLKKILDIRWSDDYIPRAFEEEQLAEIIELSQLSTNDIRNYTIIWTFLGSGIRLSELCNLQIRDIDVDNQDIYVIPKRNEFQKQSRKITQFSLTILLNYIDFKYKILKKKLSEEDYKNLYIFSVDNGKTPIRQRTVQYMVRDLIDNADSIPRDEKSRFSVHTFRHCFAVYGLESGIDIFTISKLLGHNSIESTTVYLKFGQKHWINAVEKHTFANVKPIRKDQ